jgi:glyoxylase-like metal-dependent hydrolase (beta-lactamase superfamily II)
MKSIPFANTPGDLLEKAQRGWGLSVEEVLAASGLTQPQWQQACGAETDALAQAVPVAWLQSLAPVLQLRSAALQAFFQGTYQPQIELPAQTELFFDQVDYYTPNAYLLWDQSGQAILFDTTTQAEPILDFLRTHQLLLRAIFLTHAHHDHVAALPTLWAAWPQARAYISVHEPLPGVTLLRGEGGTLSIDRWRLRWFTTPGHTMGGITYTIQREGQPLLAFVGDTLYAASVGKALGPAWPEGLRHVREKTFTLAEDTIVCAGHGPVTSLALEKQHNPFFP